MSTIILQIRNKKYKFANGYDYRKFRTLAKAKRVLKMLPIEYNPQILYIGKNGKIKQYTTVANKVNLHSFQLSEFRYI